MINHASAPMWRNARKSAGPAKCPGKNDTSDYTSDDTSDYCSDLIFPTQTIPRGRDPILSTQRIPRGRDPILFIQTFRAAGGGDVDENGYFYLGKHVLRFPF